MTGVEKLIKAAGSSTAVAKKLTDSGHKCTHQLVQYWRTQKYVTPRWAPIVSNEFGIPLHELNPDVYPKSFSNVA
jgi:hypothetical protein